MTEVAGTVVEIRGGQAIVQCRTEPAGCQACAGGRGCSWRRVVGNKSLTVPVMASGSSMLNAGDAVTLSVDDVRLLAAAVRLYLPPLAGLLLGPALLTGAGFDGWPSLAAAAAGLVAGGLLARRWARETPPVTVRRQAQPA